jgi:hypothetical protein
VQYNLIIDEKCVVFIHRKYINIPMEEVSGDMILTRLMEISVKSFSLLCAIVIFLLMGQISCEKQIRDPNDNKGASQREQKILKKYTKEGVEKYAGLLVPLERYTTNGIQYHKKYYKYLIGIAGDVVENKKLKVVKKTIGFYYDKKSKKKNELYLGLDIDTDTTYGQPYKEVAKYILKKYIRSIMDTVHSCETIFREKEVVGMVVGFSWKSTILDYQCTIWIPESVVILFEKRKITIEELIHRSTVTNSSGKVIILRM